MTSPGYAPLELAAPVLVAVAYFDLRFMRIPDALPLMAVALFAGAAALAPMPDILPRMAIAGAVFAIGFAGFAFRLFGGGDVKMLAALLLLVPSAGALIFANLFSAALLAGMGAVALARRDGRFAASGWRSMTVERGFPMGVSIALAGLAHPWVMRLVAGA